MQIRPYREASFSTPPAKPSGGRGRLWLVLLAILAIAAGGYAAWWWVATGTLRDRTLAWIDARRAEGWQLDHAELIRDGFPLQLAVKIKAPRLTSPSRTFTWMTDHLRVVAPVGTAIQPVIETRGVQTLEFGSEGARWRFAGSVDRAAFLPSPGGWLPTGRLAIDRLALAEAGQSGFTIERLDVETEGDPAHAAAVDTRTFAARLRATGLRIGAAEDADTGEAAVVEIAAELRSALAGRPWPAALARWRDDGGTIDITVLNIRLGARIAFDGDGTLALDRDGQPQAAMSIRVQGHGEVLDRLAEAGILPAHTAAAAKILLRAAARAGGNGPDTLTAPLTVQDRTLSVGPVPLLVLPRVDWLPARRPAR